MLQVRCVPAFDDNYIWLIGRTGASRVTIVDPGDAEPVLERIQREGLVPEAILVTHHHGDHTGGIDELAERFGIPVYGPANERIPHLTRPVGETDQILLQDSGLEFRVLETPGHTRGHVCYLGAGALFCGDTLFTAGCGRLFEGTAQQMYESLEKIRALPDDTRVYCAHEYTLANVRFARVVEPHNEAMHQGEAEVQALRAAGKATVPSELGVEKETNPFLRSHIPAVIRNAEAFAGRKLDGGAAVFAVVRHWKDTLD